MDTASLPLASSLGTAGVLVYVDPSSTWKRKPVPWAVHDPQVRIDLTSEQLLLGPVIDTSAQETLEEVWAQMVAAGAEADTEEPVSYEEYRRSRLGMLRRD